MAFDLSIVYTFFEKRPNHVVTYKSGGRQSQIYFLMYRRQQMDEVNNCKVVNGKKCVGAAQSAGVGLGVQVP